MPARYPERIVCLTEETTETLYLLGEERRIVGISGYTVRPARALEPQVGGRGPIDHQHVGAHVGEQHAGERRRADGFELQNADACERSHERFLLAA